MDLKLSNKLIIVGGSTSGFGLAITELLMSEGATVIGIARNQDTLTSLALRSGNSFEPLCLDITTENAHKAIIETINGRALYGVLMNAGGPPAKTVMETSMNDWDDAYRQIMRWKIDLTKSLIPLITEEGRFVYIESASVKQPMENLVLSNAFRVAVVGFVKTISQELAGKGITFNIMAPGSHKTAANERVVKKKMDQSGQNREDVINQLVRQTTTGALGSADDFASLACWLFSPASAFINGQTISVDGGLVKGIMG